MRKAILFCLMMIAVSVAAGTPALEIEVEGGSFWQTRNDQQIPNSSGGTRFSLVDLVGEGPWAAYRVYLTWNLNEKHSLRGLYAPLEVNESGTPAAPLDFAGGSFAEGVLSDATYKFNSYRLTYAYLLSESETWRWKLGFTAKIRDARVQLTQGALTAKKDDVGFVPLLHLEARRALGKNWFADLDVDALAGGPGRAVDAALQLGYAPSERWRMAAGYRTVEGGADVDAVYNFAWIHYAIGSVALSFP